MEQEKPVEIVERIPKVCLVCGQPAGGYFIATWQPGGTLDLAGYLCDLCASKANAPWEEDTWHTS